MTAFRERGAVTPKALGGWRHSKLDPHRVFILRRVAEKNDISMPELAGELQAASGVKAAPASLSRWLIRNGLSFKKKPSGQRMRSARRAPAARRGRLNDNPGVRCYRTGLLPRVIDEKPLFRPRMLDARIRQVAIGDYLHSRPCKPMLLSPSPDGVEPTIDQMVPERCDRRRAHRHGVVGQPATKHLGKPFALRLDAVVAGRLELFLDLSQLRPHPLASWRPSPARSRRRFVGSRNSA